MAEDSPNVIARPPLLYLGTLLGAAVVDWVAPASFARIVPNVAVLQIAGGAIALVGAILMGTAIRQFARAETNVPTDLPVNALVTEGVYRFTRNPIYVGMSCIYTGLALLFDNPWALALLLPLLVFMHFGVILREERYLHDKFGERYGQYRRKVRRWI